MISIHFTGLAESNIASQRRAIFRL